MLKAVPTDQLKLGVYIHSLSGAWINHPFWKKAFLLEDLADLKKLQASVIKEVVIDVSKGLDVSIDSKSDQPIKSPQSSQAKATSAKIERDHPNTLNAIQTTTLSQEIGHAKKILQSSKKAVNQMFKEVRMGKALNIASTMQVVDEISDSISRNKNAFISLARLKHKDDYTFMHSIAVCALMVALAKELNLSADEARLAGLAGLLHDIGKVGVSLEVLNKPHALTPEEFALVKKHPEHGHALLMQAQVTEPIILDVCLHHHEKMNGTGYPHQYKDSEISLFAKMGAVCDVYDAITSNRPYKAGWEPGISLQRMAAWEGHFDVKVFKAFVKSVGIYPIGSMVKLKSGRLAVVIDQNNHALLTPIVKVFFSTKSKCRIPYEILDLSKKSIQDPIVGHEDPVLWGIDDVSAIWAQDT